MGLISLKENWDQLHEQGHVSDAMEMTKRKPGKCMKPEGCSFLPNLQASTSQQCKLNQANRAAASKLTVGDSCQKIEHHPAKLTGWDRGNADYQVNDRSHLAICSCSRMGGPGPTCPTNISSALVTDNVPCSSSRGNRTGRTSSCENT
jgi:hypothetical protein